MQLLHVVLCALHTAAPATAPSCWFVVVIFGVVGGSTVGGSTVLIPSWYCNVSQQQLMQSPSRHNAWASVLHQCILCCNLYTMSYFSIGCWK